MKPDPVARARQIQAAAIAAMAAGIAQEAATLARRELRPREIARLGKAVLGLQGAHKALRRSAEGRASR